MEAKKVKDLWKLSDAELTKELGNAQQSLFKMKFQKAVEEITDITVIGKTKRKIARIKTILHARMHEQKK
jgi:ribosomal protein L29